MARREIDLFFATPYTSTHVVNPVLFSTFPFHILAQLTEKTLLTVPSNLASQFNHSTMLQLPTIYSSTQNYIGDYISKALGTVPGTY